MSRGTVVLAVIIGIIAGAGGAALIALMNARLSNAEFSNTLAWGYIALMLTVLIFNIASQLISTRLSQDNIFNLRMKLCREILATPLRQLEELGSPRLLASLAEDVPAITGALLTIPGLCVNLAILVVSLIYLGWLSTTLLIMMLIITVIGAAIYQLVVMKAMQSIRMARQEHNALFKHYRAMTEGSKELKLHRDRRNAFLSETLEPTAISVRTHIVTGNAFFTFANTWSQFVFYAFIGFIMFALSDNKAVGSHALTGYTLTVLYIMGPIGSILSMAPNLGRARVALNQIEELGLSLAAAGRESDSTQYPAVSQYPATLDLTGVTYSYPSEGEESNFILGPIDLMLKPGELVFLIGGNGAGKTTLAKLMTGLYAPDGGEMRLNGDLITDDNREYYRQHFSAVFSDFYLFESFMGMVTPDLDGQAKQYLKKLQLDHKVRVTDGVLSTTSLSYGQRKRLALLMAYLEDRPFYVFDEWAAGQDPAFKNVFYTQLLPELRSRGKTVMVITHDDRYFDVADRIIRLDSGRNGALHRPVIQPDLMSEVSVEA
jgi:putative ATP-binding cassette transporter